LIVPNDRIFIPLDKTPARDGRTDGQTNRSTMLIQCNAMRAMRTRCKTNFFSFVCSEFRFALWLILTYLLSCTVSKLWLIIRQIFASERECLTLSLSLGVIPYQYRHK